MGGHYSVLKILKKSWTAGLPKQNHRANYHVGQRELEFELTWKPNMMPQFIPFIDKYGNLGLRVKVINQKL